MNENEHENLVVAIDGPAASGKSTVARKLAARLGLLFVSSGEMYRGFTWRALDRGIDPADPEKVLALLERTEFQCGEEHAVGTLRIDGRLLGPEQYHAAGVNSAVSAIAALPEVRERLVAEQRRYAERWGVVMEGRDIGTVVFPDTPWKFYIDASPEVRERRRRAQGIVDSVAERDRKDSSRKASPLAVADGATVIDSSDLSADEVVEEILTAGDQTSLAKFASSS